MSVFNNYHDQSANKVDSNKRNCVCARKISRKGNWEVGSAKRNYEIGQFNWIPTMQCSKSGTNSFCGADRSTNPNPRLLIWRDHCKMLVLLNSDSGKLWNYSIQKIIAGAQVNCCRGLSNLVFIKRGAHCSWVLLLRYDRELAEFRPAGLANPRVEITMSRQNLLDVEKPSFYQDTLSTKILLKN